MRYEQALSQLSLLEAGPRPEEISAAENRLKAADSELQFAKSEFTRMSNLIQSRTVSKSDFDRASEKLNVAVFSKAVREDELTILKAGTRKQEIEVAKAKVEELRLAWELAKQGFRSEEIDQAVAMRDAAAARIELIQKQWQELTVVAPTDGTVDSLDLQPGDLVGPNAPVLTMLSNEKLWVRAYVPQRFLQLQMGQQLRVTFDSFPGKNFSGEVTFISRQAEFTPSNVQTPDDRAKQVYRIRVTLPSDALDMLRPGMTANVWLDSVSESNE